MSRAAFQPTAEQRRLVEQMTGVGCTLDEVRLCIWKPGEAPDEKTVRKHLGCELERGHALANMRVKRKLFDLIEQGNVAATIFYLKARCGWSEVVKVEQTGKDGAPLQPATVVLLPQKDALPDSAPTINVEAARQQVPVRAAAPAPAPQQPAQPQQPQPQPAAPEPAQPCAVGRVAPVGSMWPSAANLF